MRAGPITKSKDGTIDCHYSYGWKIHDCDTSFDVFAAGGTTWKSSSNGDIPVNAVPLIGRRVNYIGRVSSFSNDTSKIGTIDVKNRGLYYALWNGDSNRFDEKVTGNYQVLCYY